MPAALAGAVAVPVVLAAPRAFEREAVEVEIGVPLGVATASAILLLLLPHPVRSLGEEVVFCSRQLGAGKKRESQELEAVDAVPLEAPSSK